MSTREYCDRCNTEVSSSKGVRQFVVKVFNQYSYWSGLGYWKRVGYYHVLCEDCQSEFNTFMLSFTRMQPTHADHAEQEIMEETK